MKIGDVKRMLVTETIKNIEDKKISENTKKPNKFFIFIIILVLIFMLICIFSTAFALYNIQSKKITLGISIRGIDVSGLTKDESFDKVTEILNAELEKDINLEYKDFKTSIKPKQIGFKYNIDECIEHAYQIGREGNLIENNYKIIDVFKNNVDIPLTYNYNIELLNAIIFDIESKLPDQVTQASYYIEKNDIILNTGREGVIIKKEELIDSIIKKALEENNSNSLIEIPTEIIQPYLIDVDAFRELIHVDPQNAYYTKDPFTIYPEVIGVDFNVDEVKQMLLEKQECYKIKLIYTKPEITKDQIGTEAFPDLLSTFSTKYNASDKSRTTNLRLASNKINGVVLLPGEEFSYNGTLGPRTTATGYKSAKIFSNGQVIDGIGGGICQISSTLYNAALYANLEITERRNHQFVPSYLKAGLDATVVYASQDFKFKNSRKYPIKIVSEVNGGIAKINIFGLREDIEYDIKIQSVVVQSNANAVKSVTYKYRYLNGNEVDKVVISRDTYKR